jgi:hypothetical protein
MRCRQGEASHAVLEQAIAELPRNRALIATVRRPHFLVETTMSSTKLHS